VNPNDVIAERCVAIAAQGDVQSLSSKFEDENADRKSQKSRENVVLSIF